MADPRSSTARLGTEPKRILTYQTDGVDLVFDPAASDGTPHAGKAVMLSADETVRLTADGTAVLGKLIHIEWDGKAAVQVSGTTDLPAGDAAVLTPGSKIVGAALGGGRGGIRAVAATGAAFSQVVQDEQLRSSHVISDSVSNTAGAGRVEVTLT